MKVLTRIGVGCAALLLVAAAVQPAQAACASNYGVYDGEWIISNPDWPAGYYYATIPATNHPTAVFWALTGGDPTVGVGNDNGAYVVEFGIYPAYEPYPGYYFPQAINEASPMNWANINVDGCVDATGSNPTGFDTDQCTCLLLQDEWNGAGFYAILGAHPTVGNYDLNTHDADLGGPVNDTVLSPVPKPQILGSASAPTGKIVNVMAAGVGVDNIDGCGCMQGYKIYGIVQPFNGPVPSTRDLSAWTELPAAGGTAQPSMPLGSPTSVQIDMDCAQDVEAYIVTVLTFDSGYRGAYVSSNATRVACGPNVAEPNRPQPIRPAKPGQTPVRPRGRGDDARGR